MLDAVSPAELAFAVLVVFFACTVFSAMGFGIGIVGLPLLFLMFDPATSIILLNVMALPVVLVVAWRNRDHMRAGEIVPIVIAGIIGALIGGWVLGFLDISEYKEIFGIAVLAVIIALTVGGMLDLPFSMPSAKIMGPVSGFLVGLFITGIGVGGPLLVLFFVSQQWTRHATRASMALFFIFMGTAL
ncbi:MAG: sulfite exporter TauE/SafE family protein, partial [Chloroflexi bacterium]|nr:sulfite exporter TauE/SafE family protein [Chloroflexota bacterium]